MLIQSSQIPIRAFMQESSGEFVINIDVVEGLNSALRAHLPDFNFPSSRDHSEVVVVGKWYTPFMFIKEATLEEQMKRSMFYEITLEQEWERIFYCENIGDQGNTVSFDIVVPTQRVAINGEEAEEIWGDDGYDGMKWFRQTDYVGQEVRIRLSLLLVDRMKWEVESFGWSNEKEKQVKVGRVEQYKGIGSWKKFGCYLLVESFVFKRADGSLALTYDFIHTNHVKTKWEE